MSLEFATIAIFDIAYCLSFSTLHRPPGVFYTAAEFSLRSALRRTSADRKQWLETMRRGLPYAMTLQRFVMALTVSGRIGSQHNPSFEWWVNAHIRGRGYEQEIATDQGCMRATGVEAGRIDFRVCRIRGM
ncbi:MAG TPA: hypothetical protein VLS87_02400 [Woeseiaceae bacterium]|nr:hypothetical protein [Woeseiaceae bacterium]